ncbi:carbohydrate kinase family protein [Enterococcus sp. AZ103]|uniref:carbohydrate kinase family protein n=1 Tax=Enterococcus sp. AZ103 TaxID=2774628 RepID=UPI003F280C28
MKNGITVAGNIIVDEIFEIDNYPNEGELATINSLQGKSTGGALCNVIVDLARLDPGLPLQAIGKIGNDVNGQFVQETFAKYANINQAEVGVEDVTGYTFVMSNQGHKERTFFTYEGANRELKANSFNFEKIDSKIFHIGYLAMLSGLDQLNETYGTELAKVLSQAQENGIKTSVDVVSSFPENYPVLFKAAMKYTNYCIINELEAEQATGIQLKDENGKLIEEKCQAVLQTIKEMGVKDWVVIHSPEKVFGLNEDNQFVSVEVDILPPEKIADKIGAGDAFCAGVLYSAHNDQTLAEAMSFGNQIAALSLQAKGASAGIRPIYQKG